MPAKSREIPLSLAEIVEELVNDSREGRFILFKDLPHPLAVEVFEYLPFILQKELLEELPSSKAAKLLNDLSPDDRTAFLEELPGDIVQRLIKLLAPEERIVALRLLGYPEDSVGRLMTPDYLALSKDWTVKQAIEHIRKHGKQSETLSDLYVLTESGILLGYLTITKLLLAGPREKIRDLCNHYLTSIAPTVSQEDAANLFRRLGATAVPVTDAFGVLLGIVTVDDILQVVHEEDTEEIQKFGGVSALEAPYLNTPFFQLIRKRAGWLVILFVGEMLTATALSYFEAEISQAVVLALFIPLIISSGGNSGSQASTLIIRALAVREITLKDWRRILRREIGAGLLLGLSLGSIGLMRITGWHFFFNSSYGPHWLLIAITISLALIGVVAWGTLVGSMLPFILKRLGLDPAAASAPFVATLVDVTGIILYFLIAMAVLGGTVL